MEKLDAVIEPILKAARIPGAAIAIVAGGKLVYSRAFGYRNLKTRERMRADTIYPIASTTKPINATLLGMLVEDGHLDWDAPVQRYLPHFRVRDAIASSRITLRDLITMRTGLPRHDWVWVDSRWTRAQLVERLPYLQSSADFRQYFQYNNLTVAVAGHIAEVVTGKSWEALVYQRIFAPLGMRRTRCIRPMHRNVTLAYHENVLRKLVPSPHFTAPALGPAGTAIHSSVIDMTRWLLVNLHGGELKGRRLIGARALAQIHAPQVVIGDQASVGMPPDGAYALGWLVDHYNGHKRLSHGGYLDDINSSTMLFPAARIGLVSFVNFGCSRMAKLVNQCAFDALMDLVPQERVEEKLAEYEEKVKSAVRREMHDKPRRGAKSPHPLAEYAGNYENRGYGEIRIQRRGSKLLLRRHRLSLVLKHRHYDTWSVEDLGVWPIHEPHAFDSSSRIQFHTDREGAITSLSVSLEPKVGPVVFSRRSALDRDRLSFGNGG